MREGGTEGGRAPGREGGREVGLTLISWPFTIENAPSMHGCMQKPSRVVVRFREVCNVVGVASGNDVVPTENNCVAELHKQRVVCVSVSDGVYVAVAISALISGPLLEQQRSVFWSCDLVT